LRQTTVSHLLITAQSAGDAMNDFENLTDETILKLYAGVREQVAADVRSGSRHRFMGETAKQHAERLRSEIDRRRLQYSPIDW
jgi:hypothetical protein